MLCLKLTARRAIAALSIALIAIAVTLPVALAHEHREVGPYTFVVGWVDEPALAEEPNGLDLRITRTEGEEPVEGLAESLRAEVIYGGETMPLELQGRFGQPGAYISNLIPTVPGSYIFHISGEIEGMAFDETFNSADGEFSDVLARTALQFPEQFGGAGEIEDELAAARAAADRAWLFGLGGIVAGVLGFILALVALLRRPRVAA